MAAAASRAKDLLTLGQRVYGTVVSELVLEEWVKQAAKDTTKPRCPNDRTTRNHIVQNVLMPAREELLKPAATQALMVEGLGLRQTARACRPQYGSTGLDAELALLGKCLYGVVAAVAVEGGMAHARRVVRGLLAGQAAAAVQRARAVAEKRALV